MTGAIASDPPRPPLHPGEPGLRRNILLAPRAGGIRADVEDDYHEFGIELFIEHDRIVTVHTDAGRTPWSTCGDAGSFLGERLTGLMLEEVEGFDNPLLHCTHQFDLALLAAAHVHDPAPILFEIFVSDALDDRRCAELWRDDRCVMSWEIEKRTRIVAPPAFAGHDLRTLREWQETLDAPTREAARMLRRAAFIANGRGAVAAEHVDPASLNRLQAGACYNFQPERIGRSTWQIEQRRDFSKVAAAPLASRIGARASG